MTFSLGRPDDYLTIQQTLLLLLLLPYCSNSWKNKTFNTKHGFIKLIWCLRTENQTRSVQYIFTFCCLWFTFLYSGSTLNAPAKCLVVPNSALWGVVGPMLDAMDCNVFIDSYKRSLHGSPGIFWRRCGACFSEQTGLVVSKNTTRSNLHKSI